MPVPSTKIQRRSSCPVSFALDRFGDKWSLLIVRDLMFRGRHTYGELLDSGEGIATNILADRLQRLESEGIFNKSRDPENRRKYQYQLTKKGMALAPILLEMFRWSGKYDPDTGVPKKFLQQLNKDPEGLLQKIQSGLFRM
jgi:DNA-binding HxlR family transcriptional regulator